jgi:hypothetical protein
VSHIGFNQTLMISQSSKRLGIVLVLAMKTPNTSNCLLGLPDVPKHVSFMWALGVGLNDR